MYIIAFAVAVGCLFIFFNSVTYFRQVKAVAEIKENHRNLEVFDYSFKFLLLNVTAALLSLVLGIAFATDINNVAISIALSGSFIGQAIAAKTNRRIFYNENGFVMNLKFVRFQSIRRFVQSKRFLATAQIETYNGETTRMPLHAAQFIKNKMEKKEKVKNASK